jgi:hypothetical protein
MEEKLMRRMWPILLICLSITTQSCKQFLFDNPADPTAPNYQGYTSVDDPASLSLVSPAEGALFGDPAITSFSFTTSIVTQAQAYQLRFSTTKLTDPSDIVYVTSESASNTFTIPISDELRGTVYWSARAKKNNTWNSSWTSPRAYTLLPAIPAQPIVNAGDGRLDIGWQAAPGASAYELWNCSSTINPSSRYPVN